jgi:hypothetical protein
MPVPDVLAGVLVVYGCLSRGAGFLGLPAGEVHRESSGARPQAIHEDQKEVKGSSQGRIRSESEAQTGWFLPFTRTLGFTPVCEETRGFRETQTSWGDLMGVDNQ